MGVSTDLPSGASSAIGSIERMRTGEVGGCEGSMGECMRCGGFAARADGGDRGRIPAPADGTADDGPLSASRSYCSMTMFLSSDMIFV